MVRARFAFGAPGSASRCAAGTQFALIALGGFLMTCSVGPVSAIVIDVIHPGVRATGASVLALFQNLFGLAAGPVHRRRAVRQPGAGDRPDRHAGLRRARRRGFLIASRSYEADSHARGRSRRYAQPGAAATAGPGLSRPRDLSQEKNP